MNRFSSLNALLNFIGPLSLTTSELSPYGWDSEQPLVELKAGHICGALIQYLAGDLSATQVEAWAEAIECRDDIGYDPDSLVGLAIHELANPLLSQTLSRQAAQAWVAQLTAAAT